jgi:hypothetical protein
MRIDTLGKSRAGMKIPMDDRQGIACLWRFSRNRIPRRGSSRCCRRDFIIPLVSFRHTIERYVS